MSRTSSRDAEHGSETGQAKTEAPADVPGDAAPKEMRTVFIHVNFIKVGEINTVKETFDAEIVIKARWRAAGLDGLATYVKLEDEWRPQLYIENSVGETLQKSSLSMERNARQETFLVEKMKFRGSYIELMELWDFPFDVQELSILIKSEASINETELVDETQEIHKIHKRSFMDEQEFYLYKTIDSSVAPPTIDQQLGMVTQRKANLKVTINVARLPHYFIWNMFLLMNIIVIVAFNSFAIDSSRYLPNRVTLCLVLVLSAVTFKNVVNAHIPKISHFTYLDAYLLIMMILLAFICGWHALMTRVPVTNLAWVDMVGLIGFAVFYIIFHIVFIALIITKPYSRRYQMQLKEQEYLNKYVASFHVTPHKKIEIV